MADLIWVGGKWVPIAKASEEAEATSDDGYLMQLVKNIPGSASKAATEAVSGIKGLAGAAVNAYGSAKVGNTGPAKELGSAMADIPSNLIEHYASRYGDLETAKETVRDDPVGAFLDIPVGPGSLTAGVSKLGGMGLKGGAKSAYIRQAKFGTTLPSAERAKMAETGLSGGFYPTEAGVLKLEDAITGLNTEINKMISQASNRGGLIPADEVIGALKQVRQQAGGMKVEGLDDLRRINNIEKKMRQHLKAKGRDYFTVGELQEFKKDIYQKVAWNARRGKGKPVKEKAYKAMGRAARSGIERRVPGVAGVNARLGDLYELQPHLERAANRLDNRNFFNLTGTIGGAAGGAASGLGVPGGALAGSVLMSPLTQRILTQAGWGAGSVLQNPKVTGAIGEGFAMPGRVDDEDDDE